MTKSRPASRFPSGRYSIVGIGETRVGRVPGITDLALALQAVHQALNDAGVEKEQVDGILCDPPFSDPLFLFPNRIAECLGIQPRYVSTLGLGGASPVGAIAHAVAAIQAGYCRMVLFVAGEAMWSQYKNRYPKHGKLNWGYCDFEEPFGLVEAPGAYALGAMRHMHEYGTEARHFGEVALAMRHHASLNDNAQIKKPISMEDYLSSRWIVEPFRLLDCSLISDFGGAFLITSLDRARDLKRKPVLIESCAQFHDHRYVYNAPSLTSTGAAETARHIFRGSAIGPETVDFAELYDSFTYTVIVQLEDYGFCKKGEGGAFVENGAIRLGGRLPVNTHGGLLSQGHADGVLHVTEAVKQLRGTCGSRQVKDARMGLVTGGGGILFATHSAVLLRTE